MLEIVRNRIKIDRYSDGFVITITDKNWTKIGSYKTPCYIEYKQQMIELHNNYLIYHSKDSDKLIEGIQFEQSLPSLLEFGKLLPRDKEGNPIFGSVSLTKR